MSVWCYRWVVPDDGMLTLKQAASAMGISERHVYRLIRQGRLVRYRGPVGDRRVFVDETAVGRLMKMEVKP